MSVSALLACAHVCARKMLFRIMLAWSAQRAILTIYLSSGNCKVKLNQLTD